VIQPSFPPVSEASPPPLFLLIGLPGSGKSTYAAAWAAMAPHRLVIATDAIRAQLFGDATAQGPWPVIQVAVEQQFRQAVAQPMPSAVSAVLYDATNAQREHRQQAIALARACCFTQITGIWLHTPVHTCLARNARRDRPVPEAVILHMHQALVQDPPTLADGLGEVITIFPCKTCNE
jgi:predicted kinase